MSQVTAETPPSLRITKRPATKERGPAYLYSIGDYGNVFGSLVTAPDCDGWLASMGIHSMPSAVRQLECDTFEEADATMRGWFKEWWKTLFAPTQPISDEAPCGRPGRQAASAQDDQRDQDGGKI